jgi:hydroxypyruvate isomerase
MPSFAANISMLFTEYPFRERIERAAASGFRGVEILYPYGEDIAAIGKTLAASGLDLVLFNIPAGDVPKGDRGIANDPRRVAEFRQGVDQAVALAAQLGCRRLNCLAGRSLPDVPVHDQWATLRANLAYAADQAGNHGVTQLVEPLNTLDNPGFLICTPHRGFSLIEEIGHPNLRLQYDLYHAQRSEGNLAATIRDHIGLIGHFQIADNPGRHEPGTGEINYPYIFTTIDETGYDGWVSCEYTPSRRTEETLGWMTAAAR